MSKYPDLFDKLAESGHGYEPWSREDLKKLAGLNLIRVFKDVERIRDELINTKPFEDPAPYYEIIERAPNVIQCRTDIESYKPVDPIVSIVSELIKEYPENQSLPVELQ